MVRANHHLTELGKCSFSKKSPGRVTVFLRRTTTSAGSSAGGTGEGEGGDSSAPASNTTSLVPHVFTLDGGAEAVKEFLTQLQRAVAGVHGGQ